MEDSKIFGYISKNLEVPKEAYELAIKRYERLGEHFSREDSKVIEFEPKFRSQGSFRLGTVIKPIQNDADYDLDITCILKEGVKKANYSQEEFKQMIREELEAYRKINSIKEDIESKQRCLRVYYSGNTNFHMDIVPSIPESDEFKGKLKRTLITESKLEEFLAERVSSLTVAITDNEKKSFPKISDDWQISNPEGYAIWFESRMKIAQTLLQEKARNNYDTDIDDVPVYKWDSPLQKAVKILKRHRDLIYFDKNDKSKPISIIITTLAALAYDGENSVEFTLKNLPRKMKKILEDNLYKLPNPVRPEEKFTDKWTKPEGIKLQLKENFINWIDSAIEAFDKLVSTKDTKELQGIIEGRFGIDIEANEMKKLIGSSAIISSITTQSLGQGQAKPWTE